MSQTNEIEFQRSTQERWGDVIEAGARVMRQEDTKDSAIQIIRSLLSKDKTALQMQQELKEYRGMLLAMAAGQQLNRELNDRHQELLAIIAQLERSLKDAKAAAPKTAEPGRKTSEAWQDLKARVKNVESELEQLANKQVSAAFPSSVPLR